MKMPKVKQKLHAFDATLKAGSRKRFNSQCQICKMSANEKTKKYGWTFHHLEYFDNELTYRHFKAKIGRKDNPDFLFRNESYVSKIDFPSLYKLEVIKQVRKTPSNFRFVCSAHHQSEEKIDRFHPDKVIALIQLWQETRTNWKNKPKISIRWRA